MRKAIDCVANVVATAKKTEASFDTPKFAALNRFLLDYITDDDLQPINAILLKSNYGS